MAPSAKLVARTLHEGAPLRTGEIAERSLLPTRTTQNALSRLEEAGLVQARQDVLDGRTQIYVLTIPDA